MLVVTVADGLTGPEKFRCVRWRPWRDGNPLLEEAGCWFVGEMVGWIPLGDHIGVVLEPVDGAGGSVVAVLRLSATRSILPGCPP